MLSLSESLMIGTSVLTVGVNYGALKTTINRLQQQHEEFKAAVNSDLEEMKKLMAEKAETSAALKTALVGITGTNGLMGTVRELSDRIKSLEESRVDSAKPRGRRG